MIMTNTELAYVLMITAFFAEWRIKEVSKGAKKQTLAGVTCRSS
jgi:hypothetical protein